MWQKGMHLAKEIYQLTQSFLAEEKLDTQLRLLVELGFCQEATATVVQELIIEEQKMLKSLRRS